jgi:hypothetical protein
MSSEEYQEKKDLNNPFAICNSMVEKGKMDSTKKEDCINAVKKKLGLMEFENDQILLFEIVLDDLMEVYRECKCFENDGQLVEYLLFGDKSDLFYQILKEEIVQNEEEVVNIYAKGGKYPWDKCISDQKAKGHDQDSANKICASIARKSGYSNKVKAREGIK